MDNGTKYSRGMENDPCRPALEGDFVFLSSHPLISFCLFPHMNTSVITYLYMMHHLEKGGLAVCAELSGFM